MKRKPDAISFVLLALAVLMVFVYKNNLTEQVTESLLPNTRETSFSETGGVPVNTLKGGAASALISGSPLDINRATESELRLVPGIGERLAARIIAARLKRGVFSDLGELTEIKGISDKKLIKLKAFFRIVPVNTK